jgi:cytochrome c oxidase assembly protein Cox11
MKKTAIGLLLGLATLAAGMAWAQTAVYSLTGMGTGVQGSSKCATYQIIIDVTVEGKNVKGTFKQQGRPERSFATTLDDKGAFKAKAEVGEGNIMDVSGTISEGDNRILLDGYCKFAGRLNRIQ